MKIVTIIGARPQFIKAAAVSKQLRKKHTEILVHTGQHYDNNMSDIFFTELEIPRPDFSLNVGSGNHGEQTGKMIVELEKLYLQEKPDLVLVYGDTNSTLAGALAASKLLIPVAHIEAGLRSFNKNMPEEQNRILTDHLSTYLFAPTETAVINLKNEGISQNVYNTGDVMFDAINHFKTLALSKSSIMEDLNLKEKEFILSTIHRAENTNDIDRLKNIIEALSESNKLIILPLHPRTKKFISEYNLTIGNNVKIIDPIGYLDMITLEAHCSKIVTDSGGVQKEAYFLGKPCITMRDETEWIETIETGWNVLVGSNKQKILHALINFNPTTLQPEVFGNGESSEIITNLLSK